MKWSPGPREKNAINRPNQDYLDNHMFEWLRLGRSIFLKKILWSPLLLYSFSMHMDTHNLTKANNEGLCAALNGSVTSMHNGIYNLLGEFWNIPE